MGGVLTVAEKHCEKLRVIRMEELSLAQQVAAFRCPTQMIVMGVHGAGLQWSLAVSGHDPLRPQIGGVIEWGARKWGIPGYYKNSKFKYVYRTNPNVTYPSTEDVSKNGYCDLTRDPECYYPDKFANFAVDLPTFEMDLSVMTRELKFPQPAGPENTSMCHGNAIYRHHSKHCKCLKPASQPGRQAGRQTSTQPCIQPDKQPGKQADKQTSKQTPSQTFLLTETKQTSKQTSREPRSQAGKQAKQASKQAGRHARSRAPSQTSKQARKQTARQAS